MNVEEIVRETLREQAAEQPPARPGFADRVLRVCRRRRTRALTAAAAAVVAVIAVGVRAPLLDSGPRDVRPAGVLGGSGVLAHPDQSPPRDLIAAGKVTLAAYRTGHIRVRADGKGVYESTYWLLDPRTGTYEKDSRWRSVAVAPGARTAAVLERNLPARRIGLLDLATGRVERWIPVGHGVGALAYSRDGSELVATTYSEDPGLREKATPANGDTAAPDAWFAPPGSSSRTGFSVVDVATGKETWSEVVPGRNDAGQEDFAFSRDGELVYARSVSGRDGSERFYDLAGKEVAAPADERFLRADVPARLSPDGRRAALGLTAEAKDRSWSKIVDPLTGEETARVRGAELLAWVDDRRLLAWERMPGSGLYRPRLVLVTIGSGKVVPLSGPAPFSLTGEEGWVPVFAER
ncbi:WD40 repeat domain-containing protein [Streptomyces sp. NBC_00820]|uniref:WD40 repeat domain-containing protein n=1 Tax=Streptomyces sp. NBC_00820 TaxID=2975842 RepID=UPI002ED28385|nr:WD40 repeat domain-containing protein [Streptomyces sp. NBC_00820]